LTLQFERNDPPATLRNEASRTLSRARKKQVSKPARSPVCCAFRVAAWTQIVTWLVSLGLSTSQITCHDVDQGSGLARLRCGEERWGWTWTSGPPRGRNFTLVIIHHSGHNNIANTTDIAANITATMSFGKTTCAS